MISHNYTDWYDVQLFGIPAYGTGQVSYSFTPILLLFILVYYDFTIFIGVYAIKKYAISGKKFSPPTHRVVRILKNAPHISQKPANARSHLPVFSFVSIRTAAWISGSFGFVRFAGFRRLAVACLLPG